MTQQIGVTLGSEIVYVTGTVNGVAAAWTLSAPNTWSTEVDSVPSGKYIVAITAYDAVGNSAAYDMTVNYGMPDLIFDRTQADVDRRTAKAFYNAADLNRVGSAARYVADKIILYGGICVVDPKTDWTMQDIPNEGQMEAYLADVAATRAAHSVYPTTPDVPGSMARLTVQAANAIERILHDVNALLVNAAAAWYYSGEIYGGEV